MARGLAAAADDDDDEDEEVFLVLRFALALVLDLVLAFPPLVLACSDAGFCCFFLEVVCLGLDLF